MAKVQSDIGAVASALREFFSWLKLHMEGAEKRNLKAAARQAQLFIKRTEKLFPQARHDKQLQKYKRIFEKKII